MQIVNTNSKVRVQLIANHLPPLSIWQTGTTSTKCARNQNLILYIFSCSLWISIKKSKSSNVYSILCHSVTHELSKSFVFRQVCRLLYRLSNLHSQPVNHLSNCLICYLPYNIDTLPLVDILFHQSSQVHFIYYLYMPKSRHSCTLKSLPTRKLVFRADTLKVLYKYLCVLDKYFSRSQLWVPEQFPNMVESVIWYFENDVRYSDGHHSREECAETYKLSTNANNRKSQ